MQSVFDTGENAALVSDTGIGGITVPVATGVDPEGASPHLIVTWKIDGNLTTAHYHVKTIEKKDGSIAVAWLLPWRGHLMALPAAPRGSRHVKGSCMSGLDEFQENARKSSEQVNRFLENPGEPEELDLSGHITDIDADLPLTGTSDPSAASVGALSDGHDTSEEEPSAARQRGEELGEAARAKIDDLGASAQAKADEGLDAAASGLGQAADTLREQGEGRGGAAGTAATRAADALDSASTYLRDKDSDQLLTDLEELVRRKPVETLLAAAGIGFVLSKLLR